MPCAKRQSKNPAANGTRFTAGLLPKVNELADSGTVRRCVLSGVPGLATPQEAAAAATEPLAGAAGKSPTAAPRGRSAGREEEEEPLPPPRCVAAAIIPESENLLLRLQAEIQARASATFGGTSLEVGVETSAEAPVRVLLLEYWRVFFCCCC